LAEKGSGEGSPGARPHPTHYARGSKPLPDGYGMLISTPPLTPVSQPAPPLR
jgi:hypothetical protein